MITERVKELMKEKKINQKELSEISGVSEASLCRYLKGQTPRMDVVANLADALGVSIDYLQGGNDRDVVDPFVETRNIVARNKGQLTSQQKAELINLLFEKNGK